MLRPAHGNANAMAAVLEAWMAGQMQVEVVHIEELEDGWANLKLRAYSSHGVMRQACPNNTSLVLTFGRPPARGADQWALSQVWTCVKWQVVQTGKR